MNKDPKRQNSHLGSRELADLKTSIHFLAFVLSFQTYLFLIDLLICWAPLQNYFTMVFKLLLPNSFQSDHFLTDLRSSSSFISSASLRILQSILPVFFVFHLQGYFEKQILKKN